MTTKIVGLNTVWFRQSIYIFTMRSFLLLKKINFPMLSMSSKSFEQLTNSHMNWSVSSA